MNNDPSIDLAERIRSKIHSVGLGATFRMGVRKVVRPLVSLWHRAQTTRRSYQLDRKELAVALHTIPDEVLSVVARMRSDLARRLPVAPGDVPAIRSLYQERAPGLLEATIESADQVCDHVFDLLGSGPVALGETIDWHRDFKSGYRWNPDQCFLDIAHGHKAGVDIKVPWELSRGQHLVLLAQTGLLTGESKYSSECVTQMSDWIAANPPGYGVNWACPMEVAIRAVNWLWTLALLAESPVVNDAWQAEILASLVAHGRFLMANLEVRDDGVTTNHYLADVVGLLYLGLCLQEVREAESWRTFAVRELAREMERQVLSDGVHYESSLSYHRLVTEMFLSSAVLCRQHNQELPGEFWSRLERMCEFVCAYTKPNGLAPQVGDGDNGRLHILTGYGVTDPRDHRHILALGAWLFGREDWWMSAGPAWIERLWFGAAQEPTGNKSAARPQPSPGSQGFADSGFYIMRWDQDYVFFNCSPVGTRGLGTHKHNDILSIEVHLGGEDIIVDPGTFLYTSEPHAYHSSRATMVHSTVSVDGFEQNRSLEKKLFNLFPDAKTQVLCWESGGIGDKVIGVHGGYARLAAAVSHQRAMTFNRLTGRIEIVDRFMGQPNVSNVHTLTWTFMFAPGCTIEEVQTGWHVKTPRQLFLLSHPSSCSDERPLTLESRVDTAWVAPRYGVREQTHVLYWMWRGAVPSAAKYSLARTEEGAVSSAYVAPCE